MAAMLGEGEGGQGREEQGGAIPLRTRSGAWLKERGGATRGAGVSAAGRGGYKERGRGLTGVGVATRGSGRG